MMKTTILLLMTLTFGQTLFAGPFVAGGNGAMSLVYCNSENGKFGASINKQIGGNLFGYSWISNSVSTTSYVNMTKETNPGSPKETPLIFTGRDFRVAIMMGNLPGHNGAPIFRSGKVTINTNKGPVERTVSCTLYGIN